LKILLDTNIWLWMVREPEKIGPRLRSELTLAEERWLSPVSTWEALILISKGRIQIAEDPATWVQETTSPFREAPFTHEIVLRSQQIVLPHRDPADRFLAATAEVLNLTLATADAKLLGLGDIATIGNR
jgi:PIN domain nuclease of toxin-antitoxin system